MAQDSVSDVERQLRFILGLTITPITDEHAASRNGKELIRAKTAARKALAALAVPINKIGEGARTYADGVEDAAKLCEAAAGKARFYANGMGVAANVETGRVREATELATAIRRLSTSTDKGVR